MAIEVNRRYLVLSLVACHSSLACELIRRRVESFFVVIGAEIVSRAFVDRLGRGLWIDIHSANRAERMFDGRNGRGGVNVIRIRIHPTLPLVFHRIGSFLCDFASVVTLDHAQREIDSGGKSTGRREISVFNETSTAFEVDLRELHRER